MEQKDISSDKLGEYKTKLNHLDESIETSYIKQLNPLEMIAYEIAKKQLKSSFVIDKSIGFIEYKNKI